MASLPANGWWFDVSRAKAQIGNRAFQRIEQAIARNYPATRLYWFRVAPSIICRSEIELLGVAKPRFAYRALITTEKTTGLVNCRRLALLEEELARAIPTRWDPQSGVVESLDKSDYADALDLLREQVKHSSPIADSVLPAPVKFRDYHVLAKDYTRIFGEETTIYGTPFVNAVGLGGGLCSQGACFMATMLRIDDARFVYGPSEITALLRPPDEQKSLLINGLSNDEILAYFRHPQVGLSSFLEVGAPLVEDVNSLALSKASIAPGMDIVSALRSYLLSDIPVIVLVDGAEYSRRVLSPLVGGTVTNTGSNTHCILLVGARRSPSADFLGHDPLAAVPWIPISASDLVNCRLQDFPGVLCFPVLPGGVTSHLLSAPLESSTNRHLGLLAMADLVQWNRKLGRALHGDALDRLPRFTGRKPLLNEFRLIDLDLVRRGGFTTDDPWFARVDLEFLTAVARRQLAGQRWVWLQLHEHSGERFGQSLWAWFPAPFLADSSADELSRHLALVATGDLGAAWNTVWIARGLADQPATAEAPPVPASTSPRDTSPDVAAENPASQIVPRVSLITSFLPTKCSMVADRWPDDAASIGCELYCFMITDCKFLVRHWLPQEGVPDGLHARLAWLAQDHERINYVAAKLNRLFPAQTRPIVAIASYIPEISKPPQSVDAQHASGSLSFLCRLALALKRLNHPIAAVECVAGSRVVGIDWKRVVEGSQKRRIDLSVVVETASVSQQWFLEGLLRAVDPLREELAEHQIAVAAELEPGEFYVLRSISELSQFLQAIERAGAGDIVGANMDIGHFAIARHMADDTIRWDAQLESLKHKVIHCHLSHHSRKGHFGDGPVDASTFDPVVRRLIRTYGESIAVRRQRNLPTTAHVSVELEASSGARAVVQSIQNTIQLLGSP